MSQLSPRTREAVRAVLALLLVAPSILEADSAAYVAAMPLTATTPVTMTSSQTLLTIACPSTTICYAGGVHGTMLGTKDGTTWKLLSSGTYSVIDGITCPTTRVCFAPAGNICGLGGYLPLLHTVDGGRSWTSGPMPKVCGIGPVVCPGVATCYTYSGGDIREIYRTRDGGRTWQRLVLPSYPGYVALSGIACPTSNTCAVTGQHMAGVSTDAGRHWTVQHLPSHSCTLAGGVTVPCTALTGITCPTDSTCYARGIFARHGKATAGVLATPNRFRSWTTRLIPGFQDVTAMSCPVTTTCYGLAGPAMGVFANVAGVRLANIGNFVVSRDGGKSWRTGRIAIHPFYALSCPSVTVCYTVGLLGRLMRTRDGGASWRDLIPAIFVSGTHGRTQPLHSFSPWFTATRSWQVTVATDYGAPVGTNGRQVPAGCTYRSKVTLYVRNARNRTVAGPIDLTRKEVISADLEARSTIRVRGKLRLDVVSHCSSFIVRIDGVGPAG